MRTATRRGAGQPMYTELIVGALVGVLGWNALVTPRLERRRPRALVDTDRIAQLAGVAYDDIDFTVYDSYRVLGQSGWTPRYRVQFYYRDLRSSWADKEILT